MSTEQTASIDHDEETANLINTSNDDEDEQKQAVSSNKSKKSESNNNQKKRDRPSADPQPESSSSRPITIEGEMPQKKFYRSRAHCNPLSHNDTFEYSIHPDRMDWTKDHFPAFSGQSKVVPDVLDIGCGFGGLTIALAKILPPHHFILGLEIRAKVTEYVRLRIAALRQEQPSDQKQERRYYQNCSVLRSNTMKFMPHLFRPRSLSKMFFCFPDPHFKKKNHPRRIISERLLSEYAYFLIPRKGRLYCITDVEDLHQWHVQKCRAHPLFRELSRQEMNDDPCVEAMTNETEEGKKVARAKAAKYYAVYERLPDNHNHNHNGGRTTEDHVDGDGDDFWKEGDFGVMDAIRLGQTDENVTAASS